MSKIIVSQVQATGSAPALTLPTTNPSANNLIQSDASGNLSFTGTPSVTSMTASGNISAGGTVTAAEVIAPQIASTSSSSVFTLPTADGTSGQFMKTNGSGVLSFATVSGPMSGTTNPTTGTAATAGTPYLNTLTREYFVCCGSRTVSGSTVYMWEGVSGTTIGIPQGQSAYTTSGTSSFIVPADVYQVSAVLVGGGGGGYYYWSNGGGGGGALAYATFPVTPGETLTVVVGAGGTQGNSGGNTYIQRGGTTLFTAQGGLYNSSTRATPVSGTVTCYGGQGGVPGNDNVGYYVGGGGAGGYGNTTTGVDAIGGDGTYGEYTSPYNGNIGQTANGSAGGGSGYQSSTYGFGGGGGVGIWGRGSSGTSSMDGWSNNNSWSWQTGGFGGSGGARGAGNYSGNANQQYFPGTTTNVTLYSGCGAPFGGGAGGGGTSVSNATYNYRGGVGAARIVWGSGTRVYPNQVPDVATVA